MSALYRTFVTPPWRELGDSNLISLEDGTGRLLLEDGFFLTLESGDRTYRSRFGTPFWERRAATPPWRELDLPQRAQFMKLEDGSGLLTTEGGLGHIVTEEP